MNSSSTSNDKKNLYESLTRDLGDFEKNFLLISAGVLTFSITFIKDIVNLSIAVRLEILFVSWILIGLSVAFMMITFIVSAFSSDRIINAIEDFMDTATVDENNNLNAADTLALKKLRRRIYRKSKSRLRFLRVTAITCFLAGIAAFALFIAINLTGKNKGKPVEFETVDLHFGKTQKILVIDKDTLSITDSTIHIKRLKH